MPKLSEVDVQRPHIWEQTKWKKDPQPPSPSTKSNRKNSEYLCSFSQWLQEHIIDVNTDDWKVLPYPLMEADTDQIWDILRRKSCPRSCRCSFASYNFTKNFNPLLHRQRNAMLVEMQRKHQTHRHLPSFGKTLRNCHGLSSCRRPMGLTPELIVEDTGKGEIYELVSLQPSLCFCLYQYFLMPSQGGGGGEGVGSGVFSG